MNKYASELGKLSVKKRMSGMTKEQRSAYMKMVRAKQTPNIKVDTDIGGV